MRSPPYLVLSLLICFAVHATAQQEDCAFKLREAEGLYDAGRIETVPALLQPCIQRGFTQEERLQAYKLIILCHIYDDDQEQAHAKMLAFLKRYPEYELSPADPDEFRFIFQEYRTRPLLDVGAFAGLNLSHGMISQPYSPFNLNQARPKYSNDGFAFQAGALLNVYLNDRIQVSLEPTFARHDFQLTYETEPLPGLSLDHHEQHSYICLPLSGTYAFLLDPFRPYVRLGFQTGLLFDSKTRTTAGIFQGPEEDNLDFRNQLNYWVFAGGGFKYKMNKSYFFVDLRYHVGLNRQLVSADQRFTQENHNWVYMYQDADFRLNSFMVSIGYARSFFNPKRVNQP